MPDVFYDTEFFLGQMRESYQSARVVVPIVNDLISPRSVCDVGCGTGTWLRAWSDLGVEDFCGLDGDYVERGQLVIPPDRFQPRNLKQALNVGRTFDLAMSLEVAEHLPAQRAASFVRDLTSLAPVVLFSAAVPKQGGTNHINEQWPDYWAGLFGEHNFLVLDVVRQRIWENESVMPWYRQNILLYCRADYMQAQPKLSSLTSNPLLSVVHPHIFLSKRAEKPGTRESLAMLQSALRRTALRRLAHAKRLLRR